MKNIKIKSVIFTALICIICTKLHAQNQWDLNAYHDYSTYIDLNCSLNGESNGTEAFLFYADNRSESKISFTVNYTITDNCGKSHSGSWSTSIIQAGQRESIFKSVYTGCPIQKGKGHLVKNITCTVSNFKDLSKNESNSTSSSTKTSSNSSVGTTESASQRQYRQQQELITETQRQSEDQSKEFVNNATELVGLVDNIFASNSADREKRLAKKAAAKDFEVQQKAKMEEDIAADNRGIEYRNSLGDNITIDQIQSQYRDLHKYGKNEEAKIWLKKATNFFEAKLNAAYDPLEKKKIFIDYINGSDCYLYYRTGDSSVIDLLATINDRTFADVDDVVKWFTRYIDYYENNSDAIKANKTAEYMYKLAQLYFNGYKGETQIGPKGMIINQAGQNQEKAIYWYTKAADKGNERAMYQLGYIYSYGFWGFEKYKDKKIGKEWYKKAKIARGY
jgi:TPR repeat protein